mgnify:CR=1 FL=1
MPALIRHPPLILPFPSTTTTTKNGNSEMPSYPSLHPTTDSWTAAPAASELVIWQVRSGTVLLTTNDTPSDDVALILTPPQAVPIAAGYPVHVRAMPGTPAHVTRNAA